MSLTEAQAKSGKYGGIIDTNDKKARVKEGEAIYEFNTKYQQGTDGKYEGSHRGFQSAPNIQTAYVSMLFQRPMERR